jgi:hypothetical protein
MRECWELCVIVDDGEEEIETDIEKRYIDSSLRSGF